MVEVGVRLLIARKTAFANLRFEKSTHDINSYDANNSYYDDATDLSAYMGNLGDVDALQHTLQCNQAMRESRPRPKPKLR